MLQLYPVYSLWNRCKTLTGSPDPTCANGTNKPCKDPQWYNLNFWQYQPNIAYSTPWPWYLQQNQQALYAGPSRPMQQQGRSQLQCQRTRPVQSSPQHRTSPTQKNWTSSTHPHHQERTYPQPEISEEDDKSSKKYPQCPEGVNNSQIQLDRYRTLTKRYIII